MLSSETRALIVMLHIVQMFFKSYTGAGKIDQLLVFGIQACGPEFILVA